MGEQPRRDTMGRQILARITAAAEEDPRTAQAFLSSRKSSEERPTDQPPQAQDPVKPMSPEEEEKTFIELLLTFGAAFRVSQLWEFHGKGAIITHGQLARWLYSSYNFSSECRQLLLFPAQGNGDPIALHPPIHLFDSLPEADNPRHQVPRRSSLILLLLQPQELPGCLWGLVDDPSDSPGTPDEEAEEAGLEVSKDGFMALVTAGGTTGDGGDISRRARADWGLGVLPVIIWMRVRGTRRPLW
ncbi:hypothetical protein VOLCADRAFT_105690 [Volvox carteri f. nagariensis]|uniref:Uncharacterized protein n=1 Tax=Volvox carteri f. nagariensis TaxID=3068 RepID=D8U2D9_VOLCA|nr:uncharacterized protein VOLCADRAFT_105690 [Volvox carteri f. nagariensis]EFJ46116.1 hypothetical protein VOLCADRAFT_105690 [Volvox carteri f. nagariensis]|eukprot:XP_002952866.1 hypothetical protein VOLCADRAFT_105690 [Volvox carteri f. nagariensis]